jgi:hypothetical protein
MCGLSNAFALPWVVVDIIVRGLYCIMALAKFHKEHEKEKEQKVGSLDLKLDRRAFASL